MATGAEKRYVMRITGLRGMGADRYCYLYDALVKAFGAGVGGVSGAYGRRQTATGVKVPRTGEDLVVTVGVAHDGQLAGLRVWAVISAALTDWQGTAILVVPHGGNMVYTCGLLSCRPFVHSPHATSARGYMVTARTLAATTE